VRPRLAELLDLAPHPEGGWYRRTWTAGEQLRTTDGRDRAAASAILFLLPAGDASAWHRVASDELWVAQVGTVTLELGGDGAAPGPGSAVTLGSDVGAGHVPQLVVAARRWQRTRVSAADALVTCVVSPAFDFADFELHGESPEAARNGPVP
jgi:predicted cupin superfamily sugar epimerase